MAEHFDGDWLTLRERFDAASRSVTLARRFADALPEQPRILDLGAGTFSLFRWLAPIIGRSQSWMVADADSALIARGFTDTHTWGERLGYPVSRESTALVLHTRHGVWRIEALVTDLAAPETLPLDAVDGVACSALLDLVSESWIGRFAAALRTPLLACLSVDGDDSFSPEGMLDAPILAAFRRDQGRDKGFGPALGARAPAVLRKALAARGMQVLSADTRWEIAPAADDRDAQEIARLLIADHARIAAGLLPRRRSAIAEWQRNRSQEIADQLLAIRIGHRDSLALP